MPWAAGIHLTARAEPLHPFQLDQGVPALREHRGDPLEALRQRLRHRGTVVVADKDMAMLARGFAIPVVPGIEREQQQLVAVRHGGNHLAQMGDTRPGRCRRYLRCRWH